MNRYFSIDTLRGLIMIVMALDHSIGALSYHPPSEIALKPFQFPGYVVPVFSDKKSPPTFQYSPIQQWSRLSTHICAPGFQFLAGMGMALSVLRSRQRGVIDSQITRDIAIRGLVLILIDWFIMMPVFLSPFLFLVLCCIGASTLCFSVLRFLPKHLIGLLGLAIIVLAPWYAPKEIVDNSFQTYWTNLWANIALDVKTQPPATPNNWFVILYPVLPWLGIFAVGWWLSLCLYENPSSDRVPEQRNYLLLTGIALFVLGVTLRWSGSSYAERIPFNGTSILDHEFWYFAKYPPSLVFMLLTLGMLFFLLGALRYLDLLSMPPAWTRFVSVYGRTALFYFVVHFYVLGILAWILGLPAWEQHREHYSFGVAYAAWFAVVLLLWPVCYAYDKLRQRHRSILRYF